VSHYKKDDSLVATESTGRASVDADGKPVAVITSRQLAAGDARPRHSNSLTHGATLKTGLRNDEADASAVETRSAILNALPAHIALLDKSGTVVALNNAWKRLALSPAFRVIGFARDAIISTFAGPPAASAKTQHETRPTVSRRCCKEGSRTLNSNNRLWNRETVRRVELGLF